LLPLEKNAVDSANFFGYLGLWFLSHLFKLFKLFLSPEVTLMNMPLMA
jgi:hypothetical protein